jgi:hypothetical protein
MTKAGDKYRAEAAASRKSARESWERSDTDGFLSQWADGLNARLCDTRAEIADNGGQAVWKRYALADAATGELIEDARVVNTRYGTKYRIDRTDEWLPYRPKRESTLGKRGYREIRIEEIGPAAALIDSNGGTGLSGATSCFIRTYRPDRPRSEGWIFDRYTGGESE